MISSRRPQRGRRPALRHLGGRARASESSTAGSWVSTKDGMDATDSARFSEQLTAAIRYNSLNRLFRSLEALGLSQRVREIG